MRNIDYINKKVAAQLGQPLDIVAAVNDFYWNTIKQTARTLDDEFIHIKKIGNLEVSGKKLEQQIFFLRAYIRNLRISPKYTEERREKIIRDYKTKYAKCVAMRKKVQQTLKFRQTYRTNV